MKYLNLIGLCVLTTIAYGSSSEHAKKDSACINGVEHGAVFDDVSRTYLCVNGERYVVGCTATETGRIAIGGEARTNGYLYRCQKDSNGTVTFTKEKDRAAGSTVDGTLTASHCVQMEAKLALTIVLEMAALVSTLCALVAAFVLPWYHQRKTSRRSMPLDAGRSESTARLVEDDSLIRIEEA